MIALEDIKNDMELVNDIDWDMTPEEAVTLYLEWGNNWSHGKMIRSKEDVSHYFVLNTWEDTGLADSFLESVGHHKGVYGLSREVREWLEGEVNSGF
ncbi:MAG: hypothetical protein JRF53_10095 [Deltaproteobacteria bacterium]|nr:hypothetical protein [Deltaproteobacteria bacterium]